MFQKISFVLFSLLVVCSWEGVSADQSQVIDTLQPVQTEKSITICTKDFCPKQTVTPVQDLDTLCKVEVCEKVGGDTGVATNIKYCQGEDCAFAGSDSGKVANPVLCEGDCPRAKPATNPKQSQNPNPIKTQNFENAKTVPAPSNFASQKMFIVGLVLFLGWLVGIMIIAGAISYFYKRKWSLGLFAGAFGLILVILLLNFVKMVL